MIKQHATPPRFGTEPADADDLFALNDHTCADCGAPFQSSARRADRCALCSSLRHGQVGPATVVCPACSIEHQIPVLAPTKLCGPCRIDLEITAAHLRNRLDNAHSDADNAWTRLDADLAHADASDRARYDAACERAAEWDQTRWARARDAAIAKGDGLSLLLAARLAWDTAAEALDRVQHEVAIGLDEIERAREL